MSNGFPRWDHGPWAMMPELSQFDRLYFPGVASEYQGRLLDWQFQTLEMERALGVAASFPDDQPEPQARWLARAETAERHAKIAESKARRLIESRRY